MFTSSKVVALHKLQAEDHKLATERLLFKSSEQESEKPENSSEELERMEQKINDPKFMEDKVILIPNEEEKVQLIPLKDFPPSCKKKTPIELINENCRSLSYSNELAAGDGIKIGRKKRSFGGSVQSLRKIF